MASCGSAFGPARPTQRRETAVVYKQSNDYDRKRMEELRDEESNSDVSMSSTSSRARGAGTRSDLEATGVPRETAARLIEIGKHLAAAQFKGNESRVKNYNEAWGVFVKKVICAVEEQYGRDDVSVVAATLKKFMTHALNTPAALPPANLRSRPTLARTASLPDPPTISMPAPYPRRKAMSDPPRSKPVDMSNERRSSDRPATTQPTQPTRSPQPVQEHPVVDKPVPKVDSSAYGSTILRHPVENKPTPKVDSSAYTDCYPNVDPKQLGDVPPFLQRDTVELSQPKTEDARKIQNHDRNRSIAMARRRSLDATRLTGSSIRVAGSSIRIRGLTSPHVPHAVIGRHAENVGEPALPPGVPSTVTSPVNAPSTVTSPIEKVPSTVTSPIENVKESAPPAPGAQQPKPAQPRGRSRKKKPAASLGPKWMDEAKLAPRAREQMIKIARNDTGNAKRVLRSEWGRTRSEVDELLAWVKNPEANSSHKRSQSVPAPRSVFDYAKKPTSARGDGGAKSRAKRWEERAKKARVEKRSESKPRSRTVHTLPSIFDAPQKPPSTRRASSKSKAANRRWEERAKKAKVEERKSSRPRARAVYTEPSVFDSPAQKKPTSARGSSANKRWEQRMKAKKVEVSKARRATYSEPSVFDGPANAASTRASSAKTKAQSKRWAERVRARKEERKADAPDVASDFVTPGGPGPAKRVAMARHYSNGDWDRMEHLLNYHATERLGRAPSQAQISDFWEVATENVQLWLKSALEWHGESPSADAKELFIQEAPDELVRWLASLSA